MPPENKPPRDKSRRLCVDAFGAPLKKLENKRLQHWDMDRPLKSPGTVHQTPWEILT
jgi:hypothetical protein